MKISGSGAPKGNDPTEGRHYTYDVYRTMWEKRPWTPKSIAFKEEDLMGIMVPHHDPLVVTPIIGRRVRGQSKLVHVLVDTRASIEVMYWDTFVNLYPIEADISSGGPPIRGFRQTNILVASLIKLSIMLGQYA